MRYNLDTREILLSVGEFSDFNIGPREGGDGLSGIWRAQLGTHWHQQLRERTAQADATARFEVGIDGTIVHRGWQFLLSGRIDQLCESANGTLLREIKSVTLPLPADETELRQAYPEYFVQIAAYLAMYRLGAGAWGTRRTAAAELQFVEVSSGITQSIALGFSDEGLFAAQLERVAEFLDLRLEARNRLRQLQFRPAFAALRAGQEEALASLSSRLTGASAPILFEAPTGFGKTGVILQCALERLRAGDFERIVYVTSKSTGQLQVVSTLAAMTAGPVESGKLKVERPDAPTGSALSTFNLQLSTPLAVWQVRNKSEHCVNEVFHCVRDQCRFLAGVEERWPASGLSRFYRFPGEPRDLESLRAAGRAAAVCPYEITRAALAFNDVWIGDYNYVFAPRNRGIFFNQPGFDPARTLLVIDEAHNLPGRAADCFSHSFSAAAAQGVTLDLTRAGAPPALALAWDRWARFLGGLEPRDRLRLDDEDDARASALEVARLVRNASIDYFNLGQPAAEELWRVAALVDDLDAEEIPRLWWTSRAGSLDLTCLDASPVVGRTLREFGGVILSSATFGPREDFAAACGIGPVRPAQSDRKKTPDTKATAPPERFGTLNKKDTRKLYKQLTSGAALLQVEEAIEAAGPVVVTAPAPWRDHAYRVGYDARVDTSFQHRSGYYTVTAATIARLHRAAAAGPALSGAVAVFFPSYGYAESVRQAAEEAGLEFRIEIQPRNPGLAAQAGWVEDALRNADALFLVLGSGFAESIDVLGGRISHAMVVGPALPEVNAVQRAKLERQTDAGATREQAFRQVYQIPGMTKVNQALGRLVRAPGQAATVLLHCRRFLEARYQSLLSPEYRSGEQIGDDQSFERFLAPDTR